MIINQEKNKLKYFIKGLGIILLYFFISLFKEIPFILLHINIEDIPENSLNFYSLSLEITMIFIIFETFHQEFKLAVEDIKKNHSEYFKKYFKVYLIGIIIMMLSNILINKLGGGISENESAIRDEFKLFPVYTYITAVILAPILEESIFRLGFKAMINNNTLYIIISGLIFGGLHLIGMPFNSILFPLYLLSYCSSGWAFAYMMSKTNNILVSSGFHFMHNGILMSLQAFLLLFT